MEGPVICPVCQLEAASLHHLASHLVEEAGSSNGAHVMWLNRHATRHRMTADELEPVLAEALAGGSSGDRVDR